MTEIYEDDVRAMRKEGSLGEFIRQLLATSKADAERRKFLVLKHEDLAAQLTGQPLNFTRPEHWDGSIPPEKFNGQPNDSPRRPVLLALVAEAERRERPLAAVRPPPSAG